MRKVTRAALALAGSAALIGVTTVPSFAADTTTTVTVPTGVIGITASTTDALTGANPGATSTTTLDPTTVTDTRAGTVGWVADVKLTDLAGTGTNTVKIPTATATYLANGATVTGTATVGASAVRTDLTLAGTSQTATGVSGNNETVWTATLTVEIPAAALADIYSGTMTQSLS